MSDLAASMRASDLHGHSPGVVLRSLVIGLTAFLTVVDLFATQAILPSLAQAYGVTPAAMGFAVNASTMGMAVSGLGVALFSRRIDRRLGILVSLALLAIPTALLAVAPGLGTFGLLRVAQGVFMRRRCITLYIVCGSSLSWNRSADSSTTVCLPVFFHQCDVPLISAVDSPAL